MGINSFKHPAGVFGDSWTKMNRRRTFLIPLVAASVFFASPLSYANGLSAHCKSKEVVYLNARMYRENKGALGNDTGKILSLCADKNQEPFTKFVYRYGAIGNVEMEEVATPANRFGLSWQSDPDVHAGEQSISFKREKYIYEVSEGMGMAAFGIRLTVYKSGKPILCLISGTDYDRSTTEINFDTASSPVFKGVKPLKSW